MITRAGDGPWQHHVVDVASLPWRTGSAEGVRFRGQIALSGDDGGPEAFRFRFDPTSAVGAHLHLVSQFQLLIGGEMELPTHSSVMRPVSVFYTDHARPYGPFAVRGDHDVLVLHPRRGGIVSMSDRTARRHIFLPGREAIGCEASATWRAIGSAGTATAASLLPQGFGASAVLVHLSAHQQLAPPAAPWGRYEVIIEGSVDFGRDELGRPGLRYTRGRTAPTPITAGAHGATMALLSFDADADEGGMTGDAFTLAAEEAMSRAL